MFFEEEKQNPPKRVNLKHLRGVFIEAGARFALRVAFFSGLTSGFVSFSR